MDVINTSQAAKVLGVTPRRVLALIASGRLPAVKVGRDWIIPKAGLKLVSSRNPGRPSRKMLANVKLSRPEKQGGSSDLLAISCLKAAGRTHL